MGQRGGAGGEGWHCVMFSFVCMSSLSLSVGFTNEFESVLIGIPSTHEFS